MRVLCALMTADRMFAEMKGPLRRIADFYQFDQSSLLSASRWIQNGNRAAGAPPRFKTATSHVTPDPWARVDKKTETPSSINHLRGTGVTPLLWKQARALSGCCRSLKLFIEWKKFLLWRMTEVEICFARWDPKLPYKGSLMFRSFHCSGRRFWASHARFLFSVHRL